MIMSEPLGVEIEDTTAEIDSIRADLKENKCIDNAILVNRLIPQSKLIEGIILLMDESNGVLNVVAHMWNFLDDKHFDVTSEFLYDSPKYEEVKSIKYVQTAEFRSESDLIGENYHFLQATNDLVDKTKRALENG